MKSLYALITLLGLLIPPAFAGTEGLTAQEFCAQAQAQHASRDVPGADLSIAMAKSAAIEDGTMLPDWCQKHYRELRLSGLKYALKKFDEEYGDDWNAAWNQIPWIEYTAQEFNVTLPPNYFAKTIVVKARNEEIRQRIIAHCKQFQCLLSD